MKPEEAVKTWCPFSRMMTVEIVDGAPRLMAGAQFSYNRIGAANGQIDPPAGCNCLANRCAAWRWTYQNSEGHCGAFGPENVAGPQ